MSSHLAAKSRSVYMPCGPRFIAAMPVRQTSIRPSGFMIATNWSIFDDLPVISKMKCSIVASTTLAWKASARRSVSARLLAAAGDLDQRHFALDRPFLAEFAGPHRQIDDAVNRHDALELRLDLLQHLRRAARDDGDARQMRLMLGLRDRQALDIVAAAGEQADDAGKHARLVVDENR